MFKWLTPISIVHQYLLMTIFMYFIYRCIKFSLKNSLIDWTKLETFRINLWHITDISLRFPRTPWPLYFMTLCNNMAVCVTVSVYILIAQWIYMQFRSNDPQVPGSIIYTILLLLIGIGCKSYFFPKYTLVFRSFFQVKLMLKFHVSKRSLGLYAKNFTKVWMTFNAVM